MIILDVTWTATHKATGLAIATLFISAAANAELVLNGLDDDQERNARALMALESASCSAPDWRVERLFEDGDEELRDALEALGYYRLEISKSLDLESDECWRATFDVSVGEPLLFAM